MIHFMGALKVVIRADWARSLIYLFAAIFIFGLTTKTELYEVMVLIFATNTMAAFFNPAIYSLPVEIETPENVQKLTARLSTITSLTSVLGPVAGILCFQSLGIHGLFFSAAIFYFVSGLCALALSHNLKRRNNNTAGDSEKVLGSFKSLPITPLVTSMLWVFLIMNLLTSPIQILMPSMAREVFEGSFNSLASMEIGLGSGISIAGLFLSFLTIKSKSLFFTWLFLIGVASSFLAFQHSKHLVAATLSLASLGIFVGLSNILILGIFQTQSKVELVPKIMGLVNLISSAAVPVSLIFAGVLQTRYSIYTIGKVSATLLMIVCFISYVPFQKWGKELF